MKRLIVVAALTLAGTGVAAAQGAAHSSIVIQSDSDFFSCNCLTSGNGSTSSPYVIGPMSINSVAGNAVYIDGTSLTKSFVLSNLTIAGASAQNSYGIELVHINPSGMRSIIAAVRGKATSIQHFDVGVYIANSNYVTLDGLGENPNGAGIVKTGTGTINKHRTGAIDVENSNYITIEGWQMSASGPSVQPNWVTLDPSLANPLVGWAVGGVRLFGVTNSVIDHNAFNNCTDNSVSLFASSYNTVSNNTADYPFTMNFLVADGSSHNLLSGNVASTGDFIGYMIADPLPETDTLARYGASHDNVMSNNISHSDGPTGTEKQSGVVPAFLGGFVILNGTYNNKILNNQDWASQGTGFAWAQAVPTPITPSTPIGVANYPPVLHCNVSVSDGGPAGVANLNGNVWSGNVTKTIDPCLPAQ
jgi:parallel beta-helix repeat protein